MKTGIFLGRFQEFHLGHLRMILEILKDSDFLVVCVGSAQIADPMTGEERCALINKQLAILGAAERARVVAMQDPKPIDDWPRTMYQECQLSPEDRNVLYRSDDDISEGQQFVLQDLGIELVKTERQPFYHKFDDGCYWLVASGSEIRRINRALRKV